MIGFRFVLHGFTYLLKCGLNQIGWDHIPVGQQTQSQI